MEKILQKLKNFSFLKKIYIFEKYFKRSLEKFEFFWIDFENVFGTILTFFLNYKLFWNIFEHFFRKKFGKFFEKI